MTKIKIICFLTPDSDTPIFERIVDEIGYFDYANVINALFCLFGNSCKILIEVVQ